MPSPHDSTENRDDLVAGTASGCMRWLGGTTPEERADLPDVMAYEGVPGDGVRMRSFSALLGVMAVACVPRAGVRGPFLRYRSHAYGRRMRCLGWRARAFPAMACPGNGCLPRDGARMPDSHGLAIRCSNHGVESYTDRSSHGSLVPAQRVGIQLPRARWEKPSKCKGSRARSGQLQCRVGPLPAYSLQLRL